MMHRHTEARGREQLADLMRPRAYRAPKSPHALPPAPSLQALARPRIRPEPSTRLLAQSSVQAGRL